MRGNELKQSFRFCVSVLDRRWPSAKYYSLGLYGAWILLVTSGNGILVEPEGLGPGVANSFLYLFSGVPLTLVLIVCGLMHKRIEPFVTSGPLVPLMGLLASICTFFVVGGLGASLNYPAFVFASIGTGVGTAFVCLRIGHMYSYLDSTHVFFTTFASGLLANLIYFMCQAVSSLTSIAIVTCLPFLAAGLILLRQGKADPEDDEVVPIEMLPHGFFARTFVFVLVFSLAIGVTRGLSSLATVNQATGANVTAGVFASFVLVAVLIAVFAIVTSMTKFDISKLYYPIIIVAALGILLYPLLGESSRSVQTIVVIVAYNIFVLTLWCVFSNLAGQTSLSAVRVFGLGRGASAFGSTFGQALALGIFAFVPNISSITNTMSIILAVAIFVMSIFILNESTISDALNKTYREELTKVVAGSNGKTQEEVWSALCQGMAERYSLTSRETEVLRLLGRGRTASYISEELNIAYNTAKGHVRNLYTKCGVHSRQELLDLIESTADDTASHS